MKKRTKSLLRVAGELICLLLVFSMMVGMIPMTASETVEQTDKPEEVTVAKLTKDAPRGTIITKEYVELVTLKNVNVPKNVISNPEEIYSKYATRDLYAGEYVSGDQLSSSPVRAVNPDLLVKPIIECGDDYVVVTDYVVPNTGEDLSVFLQEIIDNNIGRTIYFPDGEYVIARPLRTPAKGRNSVSIQLSDGATIKAAEGSKWKEEDALIRLGGDGGTNDIQSIGSYYTLIGGTLDGNGVTNGVSIDSGRETVVRNICIKNAKVGISIKEGINNLSSDCDFEDITIIGQGKVGSIGVEVIGFDNTFSNIRIYNMNTGISVSSAGNLFKSIYVFNDAGMFSGNTTTTGVRCSSDAINWYSQSHFVNCTVGFDFRKGGIVWDCSAKWTTNSITKQYMFNYSGNYLTASGCRAEFCGGSGVDAKFIIGSGAQRVIEGCTFDTAVDKTDYTNFLASAIIPLS